VGRIEKREVLGYGRAVITVPVETNAKESASAAAHTVLYIENFFAELTRKVPVN
jgi:hypothetical protein